ncbi:Mediator of RNA polymerase II transcription subunit 15 [Nakaseomyces glabratus]|nr:Mediator of RNA polymerase II transcription subunit 15 [Nakaseomyces glabratus]KTB22594.1 Mediator of RNA polymerase II transcription subunit 15 [Nakaseomyces glabratus]
MSLDVSVRERTRNMNQLMRILMDINHLNGGDSGVLEKLRLSARNFESAIYEKSSTKQEYMASMREKIEGMQQTLQQKKHTPATPSQQVPPPQQQQQQQQGSQPRITLTPQQQQLLLSKMQLAVIPQQLLSKIPNLPAGVSTWKDQAIEVGKKYATQRYQLGHMLTNEERVVFFKKFLNHVILKKMEETKGSNKTDATMMNLTDNHTQMGTGQESTVPQQFNTDQLQLTDLTNTLTNEEKDAIRSRLKTNQKLFVQVSNFAPQVYMMTKSKNFLKEVFQLRIFVKEILEKCANGIFVVKLETVDKLIMKYQRYWDSMRVQLLRRQSQTKQQEIQGALQQMQRVEAQNNNNNNNYNNNNNNNSTNNNTNNNPQMPNLNNSNINTNFSTPFQVPIATPNNITNAVKKESRKPSVSASNASTPGTTSGKAKPKSRSNRQNSRSNSINEVSSDSTKQPQTTEAVSKEEAAKIHEANVRKSEILSRFKHRQKLFITSPADLFLSTLGDCLGLKCEEIETSYKIPKNMADFINGVKISKTEQRIRTQDTVVTSVVDNKLLMQSKTGGDKRTYGIDPAALSAVFKGVQGTTNMNTLQLFSSSSLSPVTEENAGNNNQKKRRLDQSEISPANSNVTTSTDSTTMGESKKLRIETPEEPLISANHGNINPKQKINTGNPNDNNVWDWNYWESAMM